MPNRLLKLLADNSPARRPSADQRFGVRADAGADTAEIFIYAPIVDDELEAEWWGGVAPESFVKALRAITAGTIHLRINSPGGSVFAARAIETALREHQARVVVHIDGLAASAATFIAMAGDEIVMSPGALFMIHNAWTFAWGNANDIRKTADLLDKIDGTLVGTYAARTKQTPEQIAEWMNAETWFDAQEAIDAGFADRVASDEPTSDAESEPSAQARTFNRWNLAAFARAPKQLQTSAQTNPLAVQPPATADAAASDCRIRQQQRLKVLQLAPIV